MTDRAKNMFMVVVLLLSACGGGRADDPEQMREETPANCAVTPGKC